MWLPHTMCVPDRMPSGVALVSGLLPHRTESPQDCVCPPILVVPLSPATAHGVHRVSIAFTRASAPSAFTSPAPCESTSVPAMGVAVYSRIALTSYGDNGAIG